MNLEIRIDRLVLEGLPVDSAGAERVRAAVEAELTRLFMAGDVGPALLARGAGFTLAPSGIRLSGGETPAALGAAIGGAIHGGIGR